ncbi:MAG: LVIVD repeat-containing protein [Kineosporiaceae bacterium]
MAGPRDHRFPRSRWRRLGAVLGASVLVATFVPASAQASGATDPRVGLPSDGEAALNLTKLSSGALPAGAVINSDIAFTGDHAVVGNFNGFSIYDVSDPAAPALVTSYICPGSQNDVSVFGDLLFLSVEQTTARVDCTTNPASTVFRGVRIFDISDVTAPRLLANVQTCRGSHTHTLVEDLDDPENLYVYVSGTSTVARPPTELPGCRAGYTPGVPGQPGVPAVPPVIEPVPDSAFWRIDVIKVPLAAPETAELVGGPRLFADPATGAVNGLQNAPPAPTHPSGEPWGPTPITDACHDITAYPEIGLAAGACEGNGLLIDISDPANPVRVAEVADPNFAYWHSATFNNDGTKVLFTDEWGGGSGAKCRVTDRPEWGANAIFDVVRDGDSVSLEFASYYKLPAPQTTEENCVAHNGSLVPVPGRDIMVQAWYQGGTSVIDFTDSSNPTEIAFFDRGPINPAALSLAGFWSTYWHNGFVYGSEIGRGFDSFDLTTSEYVNDVELAAAKQVTVDETNVQAQERIEWPASFTTVRAWQSAADRQGELNRAEQRVVTVLVDRAEKLADRRVTRRAAAALLTAAAGVVDDSTVEQGLSGALLDLAAELRAS